MRNQPMRDSVFPITLIAAGAVWLLFNLDWVPSFDWVVTLVLIGSGVAILILEGVTKKSIVGGPLLIVLGVIWFLHFHFGAHWRFLAPSLFIVTGALMLLARMAAVPETRSNAPTSDISSPE
jgi:hypothetical protein